MIAVVDVSVQAANVSMPLFPWRAFRNSYSSVRVRNVPRKIGKWNITNVAVQVTYPDGSIKTSDAVLTGGVWVATLEGTATAGTSLQGYKILASGIDENGQPVSNYCLGRGDVTILEDDGELIPENVITYTRLLSGEPEQPKEGDLWPLSSGGYVIYQNGHANPLGLTEDDLSAYALKSDLSDYAKEDDLSAYATKTIEDTVAQTYELPDSWYFDPYGSTLFFNSIDGSKIKWSDAGNPMLTYDVASGELTLVYQDKHIVFGYYTIEDIQRHVTDSYPIDYTDEETGDYYTLYPSQLYPYDFDVTVTKEVMYAEGGASVLSTKQDALDANQMSAVNSGITSEKVAAYDALLSSQVELAQDITYSELYWKAQGELEPGKTYCITDYVTTTTQADTSAVSEVCPIIVRAVDKYGLSPYGYMPTYGCEIKYNLINDTNRFAWADSHGKGVIYWMRDKYGNECPYDFKHILFKPYDPTSNPRTSWHYTFSTLDTSINKIVEGSQLGLALNNIIMPTYLAVGTTYQNSKVQRLNNIVIYANSIQSITVQCANNFFSQNCADIAVGVRSSGYAVGCIGNWFGSTCNRIFSHGQFSYNIFEGINNTLAFGYSHMNEHFGKGVAGVIFGNSVDDLKSYFAYNIYNGPILRLNITTSLTTSNSNSIRGNVFGKYLSYATSEAARPTLNIDIVGQQYEVEYKRNGSKTITFN